VSLNGFGSYSGRFLYFIPTATNGGKGTKEMSIYTNGMSFFCGHLFYLEYQVCQASQIIGCCFGVSLLKKTAQRHFFLFIYHNDYTFARLFTRYFAQSYKSTHKREGRVKRLKEAGKNQESKTNN